MKLDTTNEPRAFEIIKGNATDATLVSLPVRQLTLRQMKQAGERASEQVRSVRRKEFIAVSRELPLTERTAFLVASARSNTVVTQDELTELSDTPWGIINVLTTATDLTAEELTDLFGCAGNTETMDYARYHALGLDIDALKASIDTAASSVQKEETKTEATFQGKPDVG